MKMKVFAALSLALVCVAATAPAFASNVVLYSNDTSASYVGNGYAGGWPVYNTVDNQFSAANSFSLNAASVVQGATFGLWVPAGDTVQSVNWAITTTPFDTNGGTTLATGTATGLSNTPTSAFPDVNIDAETISFAGVTLSATTTYWFQLFDATSSTGGEIDWDESNGPSVGYQSFFTGVNNGNLCCGPAQTPAVTGSDTFQLLGAPIPPVNPTIESTPEPGSLMLLSTGLVGLAGALKRKIKA